MSMKKKKDYEPYLIGSFIMALWELIFLKLGIGLSWSDTLFAAVTTGLLFFLIAVLVFESRSMKGGF